MYNKEGGILKQWFGGGLDLTPFYLFEEDVKCCLEMRTFLRKAWIFAGIYNFLGGKSELKVSLFGRNLLDEKARNHSSFVKDQVPLPGKNVGIKFNLTY